MNAVTTEADLARIEERLDRFSAWFDRPDEIPDYAWLMLVQDFTELAQDVRLLIEQARAQL